MSTDAEIFQAKQERLWRLTAEILALMGLEPPNQVPGQPPGPGGGGDDGQGHIVVPEGNAPIAFSTAVRKYFPRDQWVNAARVSYYESGWRSNATNDTRWRANGQCSVRYWLESAGIWALTEYSVGYFQINICAHGGDADHWSDVDNNVKKAGELFRASGWHPWAYTAGRLGLI